MNTAALYHRTESEHAYLYEKDHFHIRLRTQAGDVAQVELLSGDPYTIEGDKWYENGKEMRKIASTNLHDYWLIDTHEQTNRMSYGFHVTGRDGIEVFYSDQGVYPYDEAFLQEASFYFRIPYIHEIDAFKAPEWVKNTIWYQVFPDRFENGDASIDPEGTLPWGDKENPSRDDFYGGDLRGLINRLDYLEDLGINGIYLCPIFKASSNHKYDTIDYYEVDPGFGDKETFKELVDKAHERGIKIMLDAVFNHLGWHSPQWQDVLKHQEASKYKDWFYIHSFPVDNLGDLTTEELEDVGRVNYETFAFTGHMPKLNTENQEVQDYLLAIAKYWIEAFDIDGWRLDVANEVDHFFWKKFFKETTAVKEDIYILGEIWHSSQKWLNGDEFHAVMNYAFNDNIENYFLKKIITPSRMVSGLNAQMMLYRQQTSEVMFNLLDSHDTPRLLTKAKGDKELVKSALAFMFAQKGTPCIFYGTEIGLYGEMDPDCRKCMIWEEELQDQEMLDFTRNLIAFRKHYQKILTYGEVKWHDVRDDEQLIGFKRTLGNESLIFYFNQDKDDAFLDMLPRDAILSLETATVHYDNQAVLHENGFVVYYHVDTEAEKRMRTEQKRQRTKERMKRMKVLPSHLVRN
ncbi:glycoside hydrolase family 13 protein [Marinilactibacillus psychrotolerans]|uniref:Alpha-amylase n=1 Tax=Marinilactibacillus psychrotolerans TaxID=191770 RepID=A0AAV3WVL3_9LACT|nr:glycoside hydrolase family 13 protein [Marinilactibacillus psychrotolerans]GEL67503.1 alpha-glycosidase [Marinilactibacillus psychrotolerans]GEQ35664.1 alpha-amylase [Marinilactibacillus psychrotolerans]SDC72717.1 Glycosidase [Marinilactibacillus psychrotolerans]